jgi:hypothetical protein
VSSIQKNQNEKSVCVTAGMSKENAAKLAEQMSSGAPVAGLERGVPAGLDPDLKDFRKTRTKSFKAQWDLIDGNIVVHFFLPAQAQQHLKNPEGRAAWMKYWLEKFPAHLDPVAQKHFDAEYPRLVAKYTEEEASWWFKAQGYDKLIALTKFMEKFFELLDASLQESS